MAEEAFIKSSRNQLFKQLERSHRRGKRKVDAELRAPRMEK